MNLKSDGMIRVEDTRGKYIFWDIDGTLGAYRYNNHVADPEGTKNGTSLKEIENGIFLDRLPSKFMQDVIKTCGAKENIIMGHARNQKEIDDKNIWLKKHFPTFKHYILTDDGIPKFESILNFCNKNNIDLKDVVYVDDVLPYLRDAERHGITSYHISSFLDWNYQFESQENEEINMLPIICECDGSDEFTSAKDFATHVPDAFVNVSKIKEKGIHRCYMIFYGEPERSEFLSGLDVVFNFHAASVTTKVFEYKNALIAIATLGAPAAATLMEELSVFGIDEFIAIGSAGCLDEKISDKFLLVDKAIRDEGTSYHYLKPSTYVETNEELNEKLENYLIKHQFQFVKRTTWTTDAFYRETKAKIEMAKNLGASAVEMECAAWCAVAKLRGFKFSQILYFSDVVNQEAWTRLEQPIDGYHNKNYDIVLAIVKDMIEENI